jgi:hypothetical protein
LLLRAQCDVEPKQLLRALRAVVALAIVVEVGVALPDDDQQDLEGRPHRAGNNISADASRGPVGIRCRMIHPPADLLPPRTRYKEGLARRGQGRNNRLALIIGDS